MSDEKIDRDTHDHDMTYENESTRDTTPMVRISIKEYDALRDQAKEAGKYITDPSLISIIDTGIPRKNNPNNSIKISLLYVFLMLLLVPQSYL